MIRYLSKENKGLPPLYTLSLSFNTLNKTLQNITAYKKPLKKLYISLNRGYIPCPVWAVWYNVRYFFIYANLIVFICLISFFVCMLVDYIAYYIVYMLHGLIVVVS